MALLSVIAFTARATQADLFDKPVSEQKVPPKTDTESEITCTYYPDLMVRETGTDTPAPDDAVLLRDAQHPCDPNGIGVTLKTSAYGLAGRKGQFLLFEATDPNGASAFIVIDAGSGKTLYHDDMASDNGIHSVAIENVGLHIRFKRAINATCSFVKEGAACWSRLIREGKIPRAMPAVPAAQTCAGDLRRANSSPDDPAIVTYDVDMTVDATGKAHVVSRGAVGCEPLP